MRWSQTLHTRFHSKEELFTAAFLRWGQQEIAQRDTTSTGHREHSPHSSAAYAEPHESGS